MNFVGNYVTIAEALDQSVDTEKLWSNGEYEKALGVNAVRALIVQRGRPFIGNDYDNLHGISMRYHS